MNLDIRFGTTGGNDRCGERSRGAEESEGRSARNEVEGRRNEVENEPVVRISVHSSEPECQKGGEDKEMSITTAAREGEDAKRRRD